MPLQLAAVAALVVAAALVLRFGRGGWNDPLAWSARQVWGAAAGVVAVSVGINLVHAAAHGLPQAKIHDEFCYLLAADTFAHGRLTNPPLPLGDHFEAPNVLVRPTYQCKYPPAQGLSLAAGEVLTGHPIVGTWACAALASVAVFWAMLAFVPAPWALLGGLAAAVQPQCLHWSQDYWGGTVAMLGGAVALGGWARLMQRFRVGPSVAVGVGLAILANSRPYEGIALFAPLFLALAWRAARAEPVRAALVSVVLPLAVLLVPTFAWMALYDYRVTGHATRFPYGEFSSQYGVFPKLWPMAKLPGASVYHTAVMRLTYTESERGDYDRFRTPRGLLWASAERAAKLLLIAADPYVLLLALPFAWPAVSGGTARTPGDVRLTWLVVGVMSLYAALWAEAFFITHYGAPGVPAELVLVVVGWRAMAGWTPRGKPVGRGLAVGLAAACAVAGAVAVLHPVQFWTRDPVRDQLVATSPDLSHGRHLVFLTDNDDGNLTDWGYNTADLASQRIIWARGLGTDDAAVSRLYPGRQTWHLNIQHEGHVRLRPYPLPSPQPSTEPSTRP